MRSCDQCGKTITRGRNCQLCKQNSRLIYRNYKAQRPKYPQIALVVDGLFIGNEDAGQVRELLEKHGIKSVVVAGYQLETPFKDLKYLHLDLDDCQQEQISQVFQKSSKFIEEGLKVGSVLVHCAAGISRSSTLVLAFLMTRRGMALDQAFALLKGRRKEVNPNPGFMAQLRKIDKLSDIS